MRKVDVLGVEFAVTDYQQAANFILERALIRMPTSVFALPVHGVIEARNNRLFKAAAKDADLVVPDGQPVRWFMNIFHDAKLSDRVYGPELTRIVLENGSAQGLKVFLYGGATKQVLSGFEEWISKNFSGVEVVGRFREPVFGQTTLTSQQINESGAEIVLCGLGCPAQETWINENKGDVKAVMMGVGAAFSFHSGQLSVAPEWMQDRGLEWLYRLMKEPGRLWRRYLFTNSYFLLLTAKTWLHHRFNSGTSLEKNK